MDQLHPLSDRRADTNLNNVFVFRSAKAMAANSAFPSFLDTSSNHNNLSSNVPRLAPSPINHQQANSNGNGAAMNGMPMIAGQQMDVNFLYQKVMELSEVLRDNREKTQEIVAGAEELAVSARTHPCHRIRVTLGHHEGASWLTCFILSDEGSCKWSQPIPSRSQFRSIW